MQLASHGYIAWLMRVWRERELRFTIWGKGKEGAWWVAMERGVIDQLLAGENERRSATAICYL